jgi:hypothetical protein
MLKTVLPTLLLTALLGAILAPIAPLTRAEIVELRAVADTTLHSISPANNMGAHPHIAVGTTAKDTFARGLFLFDLTAIPTNASVNSVTLTFNLPALNRPDTAGSLYSAHRLLIAWGEGTKTGNLGATATAGEATWQHSAVPTTWAAPGGQPEVDYIATPSATQLLGPAPGVYSMESPGLVTDVQEWIWRTQDNFGWLLKVEDEAVAQTARQFASRETPNGVLLRVEYSVGPAPELRITTIERVSTNVVIHWTGGQGTIAVEKAALASGPWSTVVETDASSYTNTISATREFFRLKAN